MKPYYRFSLFRQPIPALVFLCLFFSGRSHAMTRTVTRTTDGAGSISGELRYEINYLNTNYPNDANRIIFNIAGSGPHVISLSQGSIYISCKISIDGSSQDPHRDYTKEDPLIIIDGVGNVLSYALFFENIIYNPNYSVYTPSLL